MSHFSLARRNDLVIISRQRFVENAGLAPFERLLETESRAVCALLRVIDHTPENPQAIRTNRAYTASHDAKERIAQATTIERFARALGFKPTLTLTPLVKGPQPQLLTRRQELAWHPNRAKDDSADLDVGDVEAGKRIKVEDVFRRGVPSCHIRESLDAGNIAKTPDVFPGQRHIEMTMGLPETVPRTVPVFDVESLFGRLETRKSQALRAPKKFT